MIDFRPDAQTLLTFVQGVPIGNPAFKAAYLAGDFSIKYNITCPYPADNTFPKITSSTAS